MTTKCAADVTMGGAFGISAYPLNILAWGQVLCQPGGLLTHRPEVADRNGQQQHGDQHAAADQVPERRWNGWAGR